MLARNSDFERDASTASASACSYSVTSVDMAASAYASPVASVSGNFTIR